MSLAVSELLESLGELKAAIAAKQMEKVAELLAALVSGWFCDPANAGRTLVMLVDDMSYADSPSLRAVMALVKALRSRRCVQQDRRARKTSPLHLL